MVKRQHDLVGGTVERPLPILEVEEHAHAGLDELLQRVRRLDRFPAEPRFLRHHEHLERRPRLQRVHQPQKAGTVRKLGAGDPVVDVDVLVGDDPALARGVLARVLDLPRDRLLLVGDAVLLRALCGRRWRRSFGLILPWLTQAVIALCYRPAP